MKWLLYCNSSPNYQELSDLTTPNHRAYCHKHNYDYIHHINSFTKDTRFEMMQYVKALLPFYEAVCTLGSDIIIMRHDICLESIFVQGDQMIAAEDIGGEPYNDDFMFWRNTPSTYKLLQYYVDNANQFRNCKFCSQDLIKFLIQSNDILVKDMAIVDQHIMNSAGGYPNKYGHYKDGDFICHMMGMPLSEKIRLSKEYLAKVSK
jgi:hypothetical protein